MLIERQSNQEGIMGTYQIIDTHTGKIVREGYTERRKAARQADRMDMAYGAVRYSVRFVATVA